MQYAAGGDEATSLAGSVGNKLLYDWQQRIRIAGFTQLNVADLLHRVVDAKPLSSDTPSSSMSQKYRYHCKDTSM